MENQNNKQMETIVKMMNAKFNEQSAFERYNDDMSDFLFTHPMGCGYSAEYHIENEDFSQEAYDLVMNTELVNMQMDTFADVMMANEEAIRECPEDYGYDAEDIEDEYFQWDEDGFEYGKWCNYFITLVQECLDEMPVEVEYVSHSIKHSEYSADNEIYLTVNVTYNGVTDSYVKFGSDSPEPYNGSHSTAFKESDKLWNAIDEVMANIELTEEEKQELYGEMAYLY